LILARLLPTGKTSFQEFKEICMTVRSANPVVSVVIALLLVVAPILEALPLGAAQAKPAATPPPPQTKTAPPATKAAPPATKVAGAPVAVTAANAGDPDLGWPRSYQTASRAVVVVYEPQIASWANQKRMVAYSAASYTSAGSTATAKPNLGTIKIEADTKVSLDQRLVNFVNMRITEANFPSLPKQSLQDAVGEITKAIPEAERIIALDRVIAFVGRSTIVPKDVPNLKNDPPPIFFSQTPALLVNFDGEVVWSPIEKNDLKFAVNTNWDVFQLEASKTFYLRDNQAWYSATDIKGPWTPAGKLPPSFSALPATDNFKEAKAAVPGKAVPANQKPTFFVSTVPAEMILLRGAPSYLAVPNTKELLWVSNTESDVFRMGRTGTVYYLVAGRWFSAPDFTGPWTFATPNMPEEFKKIPLEHERSRVLASVPGTAEAIEAVLLAQVPQTARVNRTQLQADPVAYSGAPQFATIEGTSLQRAINTDKDVIKVGTEFYYCYQGVWFVGKAAEGPWTVAKTIPAEIYKIPASSPAHNVTYVVVEDDDDDNDDWTTFAYVAGYTGLMIGFGCAMWGSGYYYPPYYGYGGFYPAYYPGFHAYGYGAGYNPWTGAYGRGAVAYGPYGGVGAGARYNPRTGTYARGAAAWGPYGATGAARAYNPRTGAAGATRQGSNVYGSWGSTAVQRGDDWATTNRVTNNRTGATTRVTRTDSGGAITRNGPGAGNNGFVAAGEGGNIYAGQDGNVYKRGDDGTWQKHENGGWGAGTRPSTQDATTRQLENDRSSRASGSQRTRDYGTYQRSGGSGSRSAGSTYRGGGGMSRGGGGRRR
jgi:hypothetical protein